ncbi:MAG TPA: TonB-dependent siderophore receptor [Candidatus Eisenbacteria bacterium]|nr:TonB-dependent siderophore receptor [Candidatus Eisenbacteria bacterium]
MTCSCRRACTPLLTLWLLLLVQAPKLAHAATADSDAVRDSILDRPPVPIPAIEVVAKRQYRALRTTTLTKTDTPLRDVPQSMSVITRDLIADQQMSSLADVVRYVPGVTMGQGEGNRDQPTFRGNGGNGDLFVDGVRDDAEYLRDLYNLERVEVPRGSNAMIFGRGAGGGLINRVTKVAGWGTPREVSLGGGEHQSFRAATDVGATFGHGLAGRVNGMVESSDSYRSQVHLERYGVSPTVTIPLGKQTQVRAAYELFHDDRTADRGIPSFDGEPFDTEPSTFFGDPTISWSRATVNSGSATLEYATPSGFKLRNLARVAGYDKMYQNVYPGAVNPAGTLVTIQAYNNRMDRTNVFNQTDLTYELKTGSVSHVLLGGGEFGWQSTDALRHTGYFHDSTTSVQVPVSHPLTTGTPVTFRQSATDADAHTRVLVGSAYLQDQVAFAPWAQAVAGVRFDHFDIDYHNNRNGTDLARTDREISPRLGVVLKPLSSLSAYGSYGVSFLPSSGATFTSLNVTTQTLEPEQFTNYEVGLKWEGGSQSVTLAAYQLDRENTSAPDPLDPTHTIQTGSQRSQGLELGVSGNVTSHWQVFAGATLQDAEITSRTTQALAGATPALTPRHTVSLWNRYELVRGLALGLGVLHQAEMFTAVDNAVTLPAFTRADAAAFARLNERVALQVNVENLFDRGYYATAHNNNNITPGAPRTFRIGVHSRY